MRAFEEKEKNICACIAIYKLAVVGCAHGELEKILEEVEKYEKNEKCEIDIIICCGDFQVMEKTNYARTNNNITQQAVRNGYDLSSLSCPRKYMKEGDFKKYYNGQKKMKRLMIVIGGNHEASNHNMELYNGGWLAPNIYYLGKSGVIRFGGIRIGGISGIFKAYDFDMPMKETCPLQIKTKISVNHVRRFQ
ncbi:RNA lariat debranching enzyme, partial [Reticulomyxa filosa]